MIKQVWKVESTGQVFEDKNKALLACLLFSPSCHKITFADKAILLDVLPKYFSLTPKEELFKLMGFPSITKIFSDTVPIEKGFTEIKEANNSNLSPELKFNNAPDRDNWVE